MVRLYSSYNLHVKTQLSTTCTSTQREVMPDLGGRAASFFSYSRAAEAVGAAAAAVLACLPPQCTYHKRRSRARHAGPRGGRARSARRPDQYITRGEGQYLHLYGIINTG